MGCNCDSGQAKDYLGCSGVTVVYPEADVVKYADRVGAQGGKGNWIRCFVVATLQTNRLIYGKNVIKDILGDCPEASQVSSAGVIGIRSAQAAAGSLTALSGVGVGIGVSSAALGVITGGLALLALPLVSIFTHHAQAVAREQNTLCQVSGAWDQFAITAEQMLKDRKLSKQDFFSSLKQIHDNLVQACAGIEKPSEPNAAVGFHKALDALLIFNEEYVYPKLSGSSFSLLTVGLAAGAAGIGAKVAGVF